MSPALYFRHESSLEHETGPHPEGPGRIPAIERELERHAWLGYEKREAPAVAAADLTAVHPERYVDSVRTMSEGGGGWFDADTVASPGSYNAALHAAGGACALVDELLAGTARTGFCGMRPPGHHALTETAMGFCLFNNVAVAARHALSSGARRVLVIDWDVHHGNGTNDIFYESDEVLFVSIHQSPLYPGTGALHETGSGDGAGHTLNLPVPPGSEEDDWLALVEHVVAPIALRYEPDLVLVSAGFDAHRDDPLAQCKLEADSFAQMALHVRRIAGEGNVPYGALLEGGYDLDALAASVAATLAALAEDDGAAPRSVESTSLSQRALQVVGGHWGLAP